MLVFVELSQRRSFRAAARTLGLSPSTVTHHLQALEEVLGVRLIERTSRTLSLTAAGEALLAEAEGVHGIWKRGSSNARAYAEAPVGTLVVTAPDVIAEQYVVPAIRDLVVKHEGVAVELRVSTANLDLVTEGIDVAVRIGPLPDSGYGARLLHRGSHRIMCTPELAEVWPATHPRDLAQAPWVQFSRHPDVLPLVGPDGQRFSLQGRSRIRATSASAYIGLIGRGTGFGCIPHTLLPPYQSRDDLVHVLPDWSMGPANFYALTPSPHVADVKVRLFTDLLVKQFGGMSREAP
ncbi:MAG: LysR family transcriptional regulator [Myxococcota bacterium]